MTDKVKIVLTYPTVLPDINKRENKPEEYARDYVEIERMRYGHIKQMQSISPEEQTAWAMRALTGLSESDIEQLYAEDAAEITKTIFGFIEKYFVLAKQMWSNPAEQAVAKA